ncbi:MAG: glycoside hydrolase family 66 protein [Acidimicrobiales bacterium]
MSSGALRDLRCAYLLNESIAVGDLPADTHRVVVRSAVGGTYAATLIDGVAVVTGVPEGTHVLEALSSNGTLLAEEMFGVRARPGEDPVPGFVTSFDDSSSDGVLAWLRDLRCTAVQVYDWMDSYSTALAESGDYEDPLGRPISRGALERLVRGIKELGAVAQAYAPVIAAGSDLATEHPQWRLYRNDGLPESLGDLLEIMDPGNPQWQSYWIENYGTAADALGFNGFHLDTYGYPRDAQNERGKRVDVAAGYASFVHAVRRARPEDVLSFNQVNGVPRGFMTPAPPSFRYVEVWPPNDRWRHLEGLIARSAGGARHGDTLAIYPPVWDGERASALHTCVLSEAVVTVLGANTLIWGDNDGVLRHPYYVNHETLQSDERLVALEWHRFGLRCRDLFRAATDTSWYELSDENASVTVSWTGESRPEPVGGALFARVFRDENLIVVSLIDLTGSNEGSWSTRTERGGCISAEVEVLLFDPESWCVDVAVLGQDEGRFAPASYGGVTMREGHGIRISVPIADGWSVLRLTPKKAP